MWMGNMLTIPSLSLKMFIRYGQQQPAIIPEIPSKSPQGRPIIIHSGRMPNYYDYTQKTPCWATFVSYLLSAEDTHSVLPTRRRRNAFLLGHV